MKNKIFSFINIFGLAIGIASTILISYYVKFERSYESFHVNSENIFRLSLELYNGSELIDTDVETYQLLGSELTEKMPEVDGFVRMMPLDQSAITANEKTNYETKIYLADPSAFDIFSYEVVSGEPALVFDQPHKATVSEGIAMKYFGRTDVVGETMYLNSPKNLLEIVGVTANTPKNTHLKFDILISHVTINDYWKSYKKYAWSACNEFTYLKMQDNTDVDVFNDKLRNYSIDNPEINDELVISESIRDIHLYSNKGYEPEVNGSAQTVNFMMIIAIFIIIIAWVNYINLSTSRAINRAREVGVRKVVGSTKMQLIKQFLMEAFLVNIIAGLVGFTLVQLFLPAFSNLTGQSLPSTVFANGFIWTLLAVLVIMGTILSGIYPALMLSAFKPIQVLKGKFANSATGYLLRKGLVVFQFLSTVVLIAVSLAVYYQIDFLQKQDLGVTIDNSIVLTRSNLANGDSLYQNKLQLFANELKRNPLIKSVGQSGAMPGAAITELSSNSGIKRANADENERGYNYYLYDIDENFLETLDIELVAGNNFDSNNNEDYIIINEIAAEKLGFKSGEEAVGKFISGGNENIEIKGVVKNFHQRSPKEEFIPLIFSYTNAGDYLVVKLDTKDTKAALNLIQKSWGEFYPNAVFDYYFLDDRYNQQYQNEQVFSSVTLLFTVLSIIIAVLGLFGLSTFTIIQRNKEIGVRKVLGASIGSIIQLLSKDFLKLIVFSGVLAVPIAYFLISQWLENYEARITLNWWLFVIPIAMILVIALVTILSQVIKSAVVNPVDSLRDE